MSRPGYQAVLLVAFGGPEAPDQVMPFLENVVRGRRVPRSRLEEVAGHYDHFGGRSPVNRQNLDLARALQADLSVVGLELPVYLGNRNWHPYFEDTLERMRGDGVESALALVTSPFGSYSSCRQYREDLERARAGVGQGAPSLHQIRHYFDHPGFIQAAAERVEEALERLPEGLRSTATLAFTAHSIPLRMAETSPYTTQLRHACSLVAERLGRADWRLVYQSRSGSPGQPWLEPDVLDYLRAEKGRQGVVLAPIGFLSDHLEVLYDLDVEAAALCRELGLPFQRAGTVGTHPAFVRALRQLVEEQARPGSPCLRLRPEVPEHRTCGSDCCLLLR